MLERRAADADAKIAALEAAAASNQAGAAALTAESSGGSEEEEDDEDPLVWNINAMCVLAWKAASPPPPPPSAAARGALSGFQALLRRIPLWTLRLLPILIVFFEVPRVRRDHRTLARGFATESAHTGAPLHSSTSVLRTPDRHGAVRLARGRGAAARRISAWRVPVCEGSPGARRCGCCPAPGEAGRASRRRSSRRKCRGRRASVRKHA